VPKLSPWSSPVARGGQHFTRYNQCSKRFHEIQKSAEMLGLKESPPPIRTPLNVGVPAIKTAVATSVSAPRFFTSNLPVASLSPAVRQFVEENAKICQPEKIYVCDGSEQENQALLERLQQDRRLVKLNKYTNW